MASIRRTLSPVPRPGASLSGEVSLGGSPLSKSSPSSLSKSSSFPQNHSPSSRLSSLLTSLDIDALLGCVLFSRPSRFLEKAKPKGQLWRRMLFHFLISFTVGALIGLTPFASTSFSMNFVSKSQIFHFEEISGAENFDFRNNITGKLVHVENEDLTANATIAVDMIHSHHILLDNNRSIVQDPNLEIQKLLIIVTPTSAHRFQAYYLNRLAHTIKLVMPPILWIVVEMNAQSEETADILRKSGVMYRHLVCSENLTGVGDEKIHQRNIALSHIETHHLDGIIYFADESNIYLPDLLEHIRQIRRFGTWTVVKLSKNNDRTIIEGPICNGTRVIGWKIDDMRMRFHRFHVEMSGFAFNSTILWDSKRWRRPTIKPIRELDSVNDGFRVTSFIEQIVEDESQMEGVPPDCSKILVWNLDLESSNLIYPKKWTRQIN